MWRKGALLFVLFIGVANSAADVHNGLLNRLKRSPHNCDYPSPPPHPPHFWFPPPHSHRKIQWEQFIQRQPDYNEWNSDSKALDSQSKRVIMGGENQYGKFNGEEGPPPCEKCSHRNLAVSNAKSETGAAVAIAISKGNNS